MPQNPGDEPTLVCGVLGARLNDAARDRSHRMARAGQLPGPPQVEALGGARVQALVYGTSALIERAEVTGRAWMFSPATPSAAGPERDDLCATLHTAVQSAPAPTWRTAARDDDVAGLLLDEQDGSALLHSSISGIQPLYVELTDDAVFFSTDLNLLISTAPEALEPDWSAWAQIIGLGAPLAGRTTVKGMSRLGPMQYISIAAGQRPELKTADWEWQNITPEPGLGPHDLSAEIIRALSDQISSLPSSPPQPMLSGGRDSRLLAGLARQHHPDEHLTAWTTSSDTGTTLEELTAARIAHHLDLDQRIVIGRHDRFTRDFLDYARVTGFQSSFHVWLIPIAAELAGQDGTILDGLGGGVFLGGGFPDDADLLASNPTPQQILDGRFARLSRYLGVADELLAPGCADALTSHSRRDFDVVAEPFAEHPNGSTLTAYLTRTLPGISMAPSAVLGGSRPTAVPIMSHRVVSAALRVPPEAKRDGAWYPDLLATVDPALAEIPTAADLTTHRQHIRRGASWQAAQWYRTVITTSPVAQLLGEKLLNAETEDWQRQLTRTRAQHLIRGLALLALWLREFDGVLTTTDPSPLRGDREASS